MTERNSIQYPQAKVSPQTKISLIWIVPLVALVIGSGLVYKALTEKGPVAVITFDSAQGLEAGKTRVKFKDVDMGKVRKVALTRDLQRVRVTVDLAREIRGGLTEQTRFWVVRPRLSGSRVSGLNTLLSGAYIAIEPGREGKAQSEFIGLEIPPVVSGDSPGKLFTLKAEKLDSLDYGSPVYFRGVQIGKLTGYKLQPGGKGVSVTVFINAPYDDLVTASSRFWNASGLNMDLGTDGLHINTDSLMSLLLGGIELGNVKHRDSRSLAGANDVFTLYPTREAALAETFMNRKDYLLRFTQSVRGLDVGAPVEFKGFLVGHVTHIGIEFDAKENRVLVPVRIEVEEGRLDSIVSSSHSGGSLAGLGGKRGLDLMIDQGLRGQLRTGNLLTGKLYVALDFFDHAEPARAVVRDGMIELPTITTSMEEITSNLSALLEKLQKLPMEEIGRRVLDGMQSIKTAGDNIGSLAASKDIPRAVSRFDDVMVKIQALADALGAEVPPTAAQARQAMAGVNRLVARDSAVVVELQRALGELGEAARAIRVLAEQLERHPESLLKGKGGQ